MYAGQTGGLGFWETVVGVGLPIVKDWLGGPGSWVEKYESQWRGSPCSGAPNAERAARAVSVRPDLAERIRAKLAAHNEGFAPTLAEMADPSAAVLWVNAVMGGKDCVNRGAPEMIGWLNELVSSVPAGSSFPTTTPPGGSYTPPAADPSLIQRLFDTAKREGRAAAERILEQIGRDAYGEIPPEYRQAIEAGYRERAVSGSVSAALPWVVGGALALALMRRR